MQGGLGSSGPNSLVGNTKRVSHRDDLSIGMGECWEGEEVGEGTCVCGRVGEGGGRGGGGGKGRRVRATFQPPLAGTEEEGGVVKFSFFTFLTRKDSGRKVCVCVCVR